MSLSTNASSDDVPGYSIEWAPDDEDEPRDITDEIQLERFIRVLQTAQTLAQDKEKAEAMKRQKTCTRNAPRTKWRWRWANRRCHGYRTLPPEMAALARAEVANSLRNSMLQYNSRFVQSAEIPLWSDSEAAFWPWENIRR